MALESITNINIDFYDKKYILISAKQFDKKTRFLLIACYNHGEFFPVSFHDHAAYIRYKKSDDYGVFNFCEITKDGKILVELTEQMLTSSGICVADLVLINRGQAEVDTETGEIINIDRASVLSTMTFYIDVSETAVDNAQIESSYEYSAFNQSLETYWADFEKVMQTSKSYAVGNAGSIRENEDFDNAKYYYELALANKNTSDESAAAAAKSESNAKTSESNASQSEANAKVYKENANTYMNNAEDYMDEAKISEYNAEVWAIGGYLRAHNGETVDTNEVIGAKGNAEQSKSFAVMSKRYAVGGTDTVEGEDEDNAKYYYELASEKAKASSNSAIASEASANSALNSASAAAESAESASGSAAAASVSADAALASESSVNLSAEAAADSAISAANSANAASETADIVAGSVEIAKGYAETTQENMEHAASSAVAAETSATNASTSADNAYNNYLRAEAVVNGLNGAFLPKGTITFAELATLVEEGTLDAGYLYNISDNFITDDTFRMGAGIEYVAGTNVYYTVDGQWDCLAGMTVTGVKGDNESVYRKGNINLTAENVGAIATADIATVDEVASYLGI